MRPRLLFTQRDDDEIANILSVFPERLSVGPVIESLEELLKNTVDLISAQVTLRGRGPGMCVFMGCLH